MIVFAIIRTFCLILKINKNLNVGYRNLVLDFYNKFLSKLGRKFRKNDLSSNDCVSFFGILIDYVA